MSLAGSSSLIEHERKTQWIALDMDKKTNGTIAGIGREFESLATQAADLSYLWKLRQRKVIPFNYHDRRIRSSHH